MGSRCIKGAAEYPKGMKLTDCDCTVGGGKYSSNSTKPSVREDKSLPDGVGMSFGAMTFMPEKA